MLKVGSPSSLRQMNRAAILQTIRELGPISRMQLSRSLHLSPPAVSNAVSELLELGVVAEGGLGDSATGRKPIMLQFEPTARSVIGVDLGATKIVVAVADLEGHISKKWRIPVETRDAKEVVKLLLETMQAAYTSSDLSNIEIGAVAIGQPGVLDDGKARLAPHFDHWENVDISREVFRAMGVECVVENDVNTAAIGEWTYGVTRGIQNSVYVNLGMGIGAGIILNGQLFRGTHGASGEIGYTVMDPTGLDLRYKSRGHLEHLIGGFGIRERALAALADNEKSTLADYPTETLGARDVFDEARRGDGLASRLVSETASVLARVIINLAACFNPEVVVLGGGIANSGDLLLPEVTAVVEEYAPYPPQIHLSQLGGDAEIRGSLALAAQKSIDSL